MLVIVLNAFEESSTGHHQSWLLKSNYTPFFFAMNKHEIVPKRVFGWCNGTGQDGMDPFLLVFGWEARRDRVAPQMNIRQRCGTTMSHRIERIGSYHFAGADALVSPSLARSGMTANPTSGRSSRQCESEWRGSSTNPGGRAAAAGDSRITWGKNEIAVVGGDEFVWRRHQVHA